MIDIKITCDKCGKTETITPVDYSQSINDIIEATDFIAVLGGVLGISEQEYCSSCVKKTIGSN